MELFFVLIAGVVNFIYESLSDLWKGKKSRLFKYTLIDKEMCVDVPPGNHDDRALESAVINILSDKLSLDTDLLSANVVECKFVMLPGRGDFGIAVVAVRYGEDPQTTSRKADVRMFVLQYHLLPRADTGRIRIIASMHHKDARTPAEMLKSVAHMELIGDDLMLIKPDRDLGIKSVESNARRQVLRSSPGLGEDIAPVDQGQQHES